VFARTPEPLSPLCSLDSPLIPSPPHKNHTPPQARGCVIVSSSPEILCRVDKDRVVTNRPLAGTRRRGADAAADRALERELLADEKERAEHVMLVDLGRNDVGKVCASGSVVVEKLMEVERYSHVMHISSTVTGAAVGLWVGMGGGWGVAPAVAMRAEQIDGSRHHPRQPRNPNTTPPTHDANHQPPPPGTLQKGLDCWDALRAALPAGTVSGAPKVRAMQIIDELEVHRRGPYGGGIGHVSFTGSMDMALGLRTMVIPSAANDTMYSYNGADSRREWAVHIQVGCSGPLGGRGWRAVLGGGEGRDNRQVVAGLGLACSGLPQPRRPPSERAGFEEQQQQPAQHTCASTALPSRNRNRPHARNQPKATNQNAPQPPAPTGRRGAGRRQRAGEGVRGDDQQGGGAGARGGPGGADLCARAGALSRGAAGGGASAYCLGGGFTALSKNTWRVLGL